jgi:hypothetical protein
MIGGIIVANVIGNSIIDRKVIDAITDKYEEQILQEVPNLAAIKLELEKKEAAAGVKQRLFEQPPVIKIVDDVNALYTANQTYGSGAEPLG